MRISGLLLSLIAFLFLSHFEDVRAQPTTLPLESGTPSTKPAELSSFIQALAEHRLEDVVKRSIQYQGEIQELQKANPKSLWDKVTAEYLAKTATVIEHGTSGDLSELARIFKRGPAWEMVEQRTEKKEVKWFRAQQRDVTIYFVKVTYPRWQDAVDLLSADAKLLREIVVRLEFDEGTGCFLDFDSLSQGNAYWDMPIISKVDVRFNRDDVSLLRLEIVNAQPPCKIGFSVNGTHVGSKAAAAPNLGLYELNLRQQLAARLPTRFGLEITDASGKSDSVEFILDQDADTDRHRNFADDIFWLRSPWYEARDTNPNRMGSGIPVRHLSDGDKDAQVQPPADALAGRSDPNKTPSSTTTHSPATKPANLTPLQNLCYGVEAADLFADKSVMFDCPPDQLYRAVEKVLRNRKEEFLRSDNTSGEIVTALTHHGGLLNEPYYTRWFVVTSKEGNGSKISFKAMRYQVRVINQQTMDVAAVPDQNQNTLEKHKQKFLAEVEKALR